MKDHELRELVNDLTAVAQAYGRTHQIREQISHLVVPVFKVLKERCEVQRKDIENLNHQLDFEAKQRTELRKELAIAQAAANNSSVENIVLKKRLFQAQCLGGTECTELPADKSANTDTK